MRLSNRETRLLTTLFLIWAGCSLGCGGDDDPSSTIRGPRLEWDQQADSLEQARSLSFRLYVDNVGRALSGAACSPGGPAYVCAAPLPQIGSGRHVLQLASVLNGVESPRSAPLEASGTQGLSSVAQEPDSPVSLVPSTACLTGPATECYAVREVASGLFGINELSPAPDGRLFVVEGSKRIRVVVDGGLIPEPALELNDEQAQIIGLAVDTSSFPESRFVFVAWTEEGRSDQVQLNVTRYREVANTLGEGATILTGIAMPLDLPASIAVDRDGYVYIALPAQGPSSTGSGVVLRITRDGGVPPDNRLGLPAIASGYSAPTSLFIDPSQKTLWLGGRNAASAYALGFIPTSPPGQSQSPHVITQVASDQPVSFVLSKEQESSQAALFVLANGLLSKAIQTQDGAIASYAALDLGTLRPVTAVGTESGAMYIATDTAIFELRRAQLR